MNYSKQRDYILTAMRMNPIHPTAEELYTLLKKDHPKLSLATVYRNLNQLVQMGLVRKITGLENSDHFDHQVHPHYHFLCQSCGKIYDVPETVAPDVDTLVARSLNAVVTRHDMSFSGVCSDCQKRPHK